MKIFNLLLCWACMVALSPCFAAAPPPLDHSLDHTPALVTPPLTQTLQKILQPVSPPSAPSQNQPSAATAAADSVAPVTVPDIAEQISDTFATHALGAIADILNAIEINSANLNAYQTAWTDFAHWLALQSVDARRLAMWQDISHNALIVIGAPLLVCAALSLFLWPLRLRLRRRHPPTLPGRIGLLFGLFALRLIPILIFLAGALKLLDENEGHRLPRFVLLSAIYALFLSHTLRQIIRGILAPTVNQLRLLPLSQYRARYLYHWLSAFSLLIVYGYFLIDIGAALHVPATMSIVFQNSLGAVVAIMLIIVTLQNREPVAAWLRPSAATAEDTHPQSFIDASRVWLSAHWQSLSIIYIAIGYGVSLLGINGGIALLGRATLLSLMILALGRFCFAGLDHWKTPRAGQAALAHRQMVAFALQAVLWLALTMIVCAIWGFHAAAFIASATGQKIWNALLSIVATLLILTALYETINFSIERHLNRRDKAGKTLVATARARTMLPMLRHTLFIVFCAIQLLVMLSAIGINIAPLLAGAGVIGVAIGFGSQTLVKDFLTGLFIVAENGVAVGDAVTIGPFFGFVETLTIRTIRLRDWDGSLHIVPFSEVTKITNMSKGYAYALVDIGVSYASDLDHVMAVIREVGAAIQDDPVFKRVILEPIEVMGVEHLGDSAVVVRSRIRTRPGKQWDVRRLLLLRIKQRFDHENIEIPFPTVTHIVTPDKGKN